MPRFRKCRHACRQNRKRNLFPIGEDDCTLDRILELPNIARPIVAGQREHRVFSKAVDRLVVFICIQLQEVHGQKLHVVLALTKRRNSNIDDIQAIEKIFAKALLFDFLVQIFVGRSENPDVGVDGPCSTETLEFAVLQHAQQLDLNGWADLADFVEKQRPPIGEFESAFFACVRARERTLLIPK